MTVYAGVLSSQSKSRSRIVPKASAAEDQREEKKPKAGGGRYIPWHVLLRWTFGEEIVCPDWGGALGLIAMVKTERTIQTFLRFYLAGQKIVSQAMNVTGPDGRMPRIRLD